VKNIIFEDCPKLKMIDVIYRLAAAETLVVKGCKSLSAVGDLGGTAVVTSETIDGVLKEWHRRQLVLHRCPSLASLRGLSRARCAFSDRNLHSRMPLDPTHVRLKRTCVCPMAFLSEVYCSYRCLHELCRNTEGTHVGLTKMCGARF
jgi:hypothetical protein